MLKYCKNNRKKLSLDKINIEEDIDEIYP